MSYRQFVRYRPFYITEAKSTDYNTHACYQHENIRLLIDSMAHRGIIQTRGCRCCSKALHAMLKTKNACTGNAKSAVLMRLVWPDTTPLMLQDGNSGKERMRLLVIKSTRIGSRKQSVALLNNWLRSSGMSWKQLEAINTTGYTRPENLGKLKKRLLKMKSSHT